MSKCYYFNCPHYGKSSCTHTIVDGIWKCTRELDGKTLILSTSTTGTGKIVHAGTETRCTAPDCLDCERNDECNHIGLFEEVSECHRQ